MNTTLPVTWNLLASAPSWSPWVVARMAWNTCTNLWHNSGVRCCFDCCLLPSLDHSEGHRGSTPLLHSGDLVLVLLIFLFLTCLFPHVWQGVALILFTLRAVRVAKVQEALVVLLQDLVELKFFVLQPGELVLVLRGMALTPAAWGLPSG